MNIQEEMRVQNEEPQPSPSAQPPAGEYGPRPTTLRRGGTYADPRLKSVALATIMSAVPGLGQCYVGYYQQGFKENNDVVKGVATSQQIPLFDFAAVMQQDVKYWADGRHSNEAVALVKAKLFAEFIDSQGLIEK